MKHSSRMKNRITKMAQARDIDLTQAGAHFKVKSPGFMDLCIENIGRNCISVTHYYEQNGDLCQDPEIVFHVSPIHHGDWYPIEWTTPQFMMFGKVGGGYQKVLWLDDKAESWTKANVKAQARLAAFANTWSTNLGRQGFK